MVFTAKLKEEAAAAWKTSLTVLFIHPIAR
jgi:hypothetical protein